MEKSLRTKIRIFRISRTQAAAVQVDDVDAF
jgi:hypothetical protein